MPDSRQRLSDDQLAALKALHEALARELAGALSGLVRSMVSVKLAGIEQVARSQFAASLARAACISVVKADPLEGSLVVGIDRPLMFALVDRMLGGGREPTPLLDRPATEIELRLMTRVTAIFLEELRRAWNSLVDLRLSLQQVEPDWRAAQADLPNGASVQFTFGVVVGQSEGTMSLSIPLGGLEGLGPKLTCHRLASDRASFPRRVQPAADEVELSAELAETSISAADLAALSAGDIITTEQSVDAPIVLRVDGAAKYQARPGALGDRKAVQIESQPADSPPASGS